ncbi:MAG: 2-C-methyl-D-erythritol 2,4-cyclodiphosphate synthase [Gudongella sp.]|jgi:2-C-methyl-D-erythritol 2,4-cyclodiphosphate synthase|nr:2-C-methyl-D-erythritol 2,4-cyclodiphosphate synthase [Gudongella sp.]
MRIGLGYDVHKLVPDRRLIIGGVEIPHSLGLLGHSDADVLVHCLMDAMLGALALGDIGKHFPDTDMEYKDISSLLLLKRVNDMITGRGYRLSNADCVIAAQKPKLAPYIDEMQRNIAKTLSVADDAVGIKATTTEWLGFEGREEGISAQCVCLLEKII